MASAAAQASISVIAARLVITAAMIALLIAAARIPIAVRASHVEAYRAQSAAGRGAPDRPAAAPLKIFTERAP